MKVNLKIPAPKTVPYTVKAKDYTEAANFLLDKPIAACYMPNPNYKFKKNDDGDTCEITITAKPTITIPKWSGASKLKGDEKKWWFSMLKALAKHEAKHHKIFEADAKKFKKENESAGDFPEGDTAGILFDFFTDSQTNQDKFDKSSKNGAREGVTLPV